jgi:hypothetical protein
VGSGPAVPGRIVATLAARARIRELEESPRWGPDRGSRQRDRKNGAITEEIVRLSIRYGLMSRETSYVAIGRRETPVVGDVQLRRVPIALTARWGGLTGDIPLSWARRLAGVFQASEADHSALAQSLDAFGASAPPTLFFSAAAPVERALRLPDRADRMGALRPSRSGWSTVRARHVLVSLQRADGSWDLTTNFAGAIGHDLERLESAMGAEGDPGETRCIWATSLALVWLSTHAADLEDQWQLLAGKAQRWVAARAPDDGAAWIEKAERLLRTA